MERGRSAGIDLFLEDGAYTTLTSAVSILVILSLLFAIASGIWSMSRAGDTQVAADVTALAGANVVSSYHTAATVLDASVLSMGLAAINISPMVFLIFYHKNCLIQKVKSTYNSICYLKF